MIDTGAAGNATKVGEVVWIAFERVGGPIGSNVTIQVVGANDVTFQNPVFAERFDQDTGLGSTTFANNFLFADTFEFDGNNLALEGAVARVTNGMTVSNAGLFTTDSVTDLTAGTFVRTPLTPAALVEPSQLPPVASTSKVLSATLELKLVGPLNQNVAFTTNAANQIITFQSALTNGAQNENVVLSAGTAGER